MRDLLRNIKRGKVGPEFIVTFKGCLIFFYFNSRVFQVKILTSSYKHSLRNNKICNILIKFHCLVG